MPSPEHLRDVVQSNPNKLDKAFYLRTYHDVNRFGDDPVKHFLLYGWREGRIPWDGADESATTSESTVSRVKGPLPTHVASTASYPYELSNPKHLPPLGLSPVVRAVIPTIWKKPELTRALIQWLLDHGVHCTVVDNRTTGPAELIPGVHVVRDTLPFNFSRLCNIGFRTAVSEKSTGIVLFMNDDQVIIDESWLDKIVAAFAADDTIGCAGPVTLNPDGTIQGMGAVCRMEGSGVIGVHHRAPGAEIVECHSIGGSCMAFRVEAFPGFDEGYRITHSDNVVCMDTREAGYRVVTVMDSRIEHHEKSSRGPLGDPVEDIQRFWATRWSDILLSAPKAKCNIYRRDLVRQENIHSIVVIKLDHIGDIFMSRDSISMLGKKFPNAQITVICASWAQDLFRKWGYSTIPCDFWTEGGVTAQQRGLSPQDRDRLRAIHCDLAIDLRVEKEAREVLDLVNAPHKYAYGRNNLPYLQSAMSHKKQLEVLVESMDVWDKGTILNKTGWIGINRHASSRGKTWPLWDSLVAWLDGKDIPYKEYGPGMVPMEDFAELVASECRVYVGQDTGPTHAVAGTGLPVVEVIGGIVPVWEWLATGNVIGLGVDKPCSPCYKPSGCPGMACMGVSVMDVLWAIGQAVQ